MLPFNLPELEVSGLALVTAIDDCPPIAGGEGSVVTARFVTREVHVVASVDVLGADGTVETITGTTIHPVWSVDRQEWVPLAELAQGEGLCCDTESLRLGFHSSLPPKVCGLVLSVSLSRVTQPVYNIEVHGDHVYQVGELGVVVHNLCPGFHHFAPRAWGSNVPYGSKYLKKLSKSEHTDIHRGFSNFLKLRTGHYFNAKSGSEWQSMLDFRTRRGLLIEFHKTFENGIYWNDFVTEILKARKAGYNPWG